MTLLIIISSNLVVSNVIALLINLDSMYLSFTSYYFIVKSSWSIFSSIQIAFSTLSILEILLALGHLLDQYHYLAYVDLIHLAISLEIYHTQEN